MPGYINTSGNYSFDELGIVHVNVKSNARYLRARWKGGALVVTAPKGVSYDDVLDFLRRNSLQIDQVKPGAPYWVGQEFDFGELRVRIGTQRQKPGLVLCLMNGSEGRIDVHQDLQIDSPGTIRAISKLLCSMAQKHAPSVLLPRARQLAAEVDAKPLAWEISNGHRVLGHCNSNGVIALSYCLVFYPQHLRDYVIYHELAHLTELNHSVRFHQLCDSYCGGRESELQAELRAYKLPVIR